MKSHAMKDLITICLDCHKGEHGYRTRLDGEPDAVKAARPVRVRRESRMFNKIDWKVRSLPGDALLSAPA
jgi:hypothetical protein